MVTANWKRILSAPRHFEGAISERYNGTACVQTNEKQTNDFRTITRITFFKKEFQFFSKSEAAGYVGEGRGLLPG